MILYKYVCAEVARNILQNKCIAFSRMHTLNDPFEMHSICNFPVLLEESRVKTDSFDDSTLPYFINLSYGVLSLTRDPLNIIMWSHYANNHSGMVIGIDVNHCGFCNENRNLIPAQHGDVIYSKNIPKIPKQTTENARPGFSTSYSSIFSEYGVNEWLFFKHVFLYKSYEWAYEEEVRIIKALGADGEWEQHQTSEPQRDSLVDFNSYIDLYNIPEKSIKEIYLGARFPLNKITEYVPKNMLKEINIMQCIKSKETFSLLVESLNNRKLHGCD